LRLGEFLFRSLSRGRICGFLPIEIARISSRGIEGIPRGNSSSSVREGEGKLFSRYSRDGIRRRSRRESLLVLFSPQSASEFPDWFPPNNGGSNAPRVYRKANNLAFNVSVQARAER